MSDIEQTEPRGELTMRLLAMPADANAAGDIFGGWVVSQMDLAAAMTAADRSRSRVATVAINTLVFRKPVKIGDTLSVYSTIQKIGRSSITVSLEAWAQRYQTQDQVKVTEGVFVMVAMNEAGEPIAVPPEA
ncbi:MULTISPECIES: acyl-CoA thioesterase [unclassified Aureimonas]|uniref:acyl-CoA thioesterase n=1 Tax=unclassified Aureimonas TaxID=2615206 RepID=UPI0006FB022A|nr:MULTISPECIES: acyl-CoA thioesterase [unclassified Aureimonas]KQT69626.1 acyl-CoA thioesterase [Aureimonas sp. Leaf427]KQT80977.1 acyl-CoA thioesterase [Aureimonas sp. Leaf460]